MKIAWDETDLAMCQSTVASAARRLPLDALATMVEGVMRREGSYEIRIEKSDGRVRVEVGVVTPRYTIRSVLAFVADGEYVLKVTEATPRVW